MKIAAYFDGTAVRPLQPIDLEPNQKVYINIPRKKLRKAIDEEQIRRQHKAIDDVFGMLTEDETNALDQSLSQHLKFKTIEL